MNSRPAGTDTDPVGSPSKNGMTLRNPCQCRLWASKRSGRSASPRLVSCTRNSWSGLPSYCLTQNSGAECWALFFWASRWVSLSPVTLRNPKMYVVKGAGARLSGWKAPMGGSSREVDPPVGAGQVEARRLAVGRGRLRRAPGPGPAHTPVPATTAALPARPRSRRRSSRTAAERAGDGRPPTTVLAVLLSLRRVLMVSPSPEVLLGCAGLVVPRMAGHGVAPFGSENASMSRLLDVSPWAVPLNQVDHVPAEKRDDVLVLDRPDPREGGVRAEGQVDVRGVDPAAPSTRAVVGHPVGAGVEDPRERAVPFQR